MSALYLSASRFSTTTWKLESINQAKALLQEIDDPYLRMSIAQRESSLLRITGNRSQSDDVLAEFIGHNANTKPDQISPPADSRCNARIGELIHSRAENLIFTDNLEAAWHNLKRWRPIDGHPPSSMEKTVQVSKNVSLGRILKMQGHFEEGLVLLRQTLEQIEAEDIAAGGWRRVLLANIADLYCELGQPADAQAVLIPELASMKLARSHNMSSGRRLQLVLAESYLRDGSYQQSIEVLNYVRRIIEKMKDPDNITKRNLFRAWTMLARIAHFQEHWEEALHCWRESLKVLELLGEIRRPGAAVVYFGVAFALLKCGQVQESANVVDQAGSLVGVAKDRRYHMTGLDSYWRDHVLEGLAQNAIMPPESA